MFLDRLVKNLALRFLIHWCNQEKCEVQNEMEEHIQVSFGKKKKKLEREETRIIG